MKSYQVTGYGEALEARDLTTPEPQGGEVLVKIAACGVCHSDVHLWEGYFDLGEGQKLHLGKVSAMVPFTPGHEIIGHVTAVGPDAKGVSVGDKRVVYPWIGCGACSVCQSGNENLCARGRNLGVHVDGGFSDHVIVPDAKYLFDMGSVDDALACTYACSGITAFGAIKKAAHLSKDDPLMVIGAGGVGLMGVRFVKAVLGISPIVVDIDENRRAAAMDAGASQAIDPNDKDAIRAFMKATGGAAAAIDFVGAEQTAQTGLKVLRTGGKLVIVGLFGGQLKTPLPMIPMRALTIEGSYVGTPAEMAEMVELVRTGVIPPIPVETRDMSRASETLDDLKSGRVVGRAVLTP